MTPSPTLSRRNFLALAATGALATLAACGGGEGAAGSDGSGSAATGDTSSSGGVSSSSSEGASSSSASGTITSVAADDPYGTGTHHVSIEVEGFGTMQATLNAAAAPVTVSNFCHLAADGFYDGLTFHRIISGFMIQGGDPQGDGTGGSGTTILGEFSANGVDNPMTHRRGTISMARSTDYDSASSQFFIMQEANSSLDGQYAAFGTVNEGIEVVDAIVEATPTEDDNGTVAAENQPKIASITVID